ncbi:MAG TPA: protein phosphatase [Desulfuromonadales bacterium]|nr:protein phosphatase [Desulfuromonadales bacterium]
MILYIIRHAEAIEENETLQDQWRYLTEKGRAAARKISLKIFKHGPKARLTVTSPLTRAVQTAEILAEKACRRNVIIASPLLLPGADIAELVNHLKQYGDAKRVMLVGHEPQLGILIARLLGLEGAIVPIKKGSCVALKLDQNSIEKPACFLWHLTPGKNKISSFQKAFP